MKILVTGGAGFIGSHVVDRYVDQGHEVVILDNLSTGFKRNLNREAKFYKASVCDDRLSEVMKQEKFDIVNHHAAQIDVRKSVDDPFYDAEQNILGSLNLIVNSLRSGVKKIVYASTGGAVYGEVKKLPASEDCPVNPISQYGISKHTVEHYLYLYAKLYGLKTTILRYPNVYGPRQNPEGEAGVVAIFAGQLLNAQTPTIFGKGDKARDYTYVGDIAEANILALSKGNDDILNIGTGIETTDQEVYETIAAAVGSTIKPNYAEVREGEIYRICLDAGKARKILGWTPKIEFKEGIKNTVKYFQEFGIGVSN